MSDRLTVTVQRASRADHLPADDELRAWARAALAGRREPTELNLRLVDEAESAELNLRYRGREGPTNVLSFGFDAPPGVDLALLGDLVICAPVVAREAAEQGKPARAHWAHMVIHGVLHLLGYDHQTAAEAAAMEALEIELLGRIGYSNPYEC